MLLLLYSSSPSNNQVAKGPSYNQQFRLPLNSLPATSQAILIPSSPQHAQKGQPLVQFPFVQNATQASVTSPSATSATNTESENSLDSSQNVKYLKGLHGKPGLINCLLCHMHLEYVYYGAFSPLQVVLECLFTDHQQPLYSLG